jgi:adenosylcobinamide-GDP ribazoletransferase
VRSLLAAIAFLTTIPVGKVAAFDAADVAHSAGWFPFIGVLLGTVYSLAAALLRNCLPPEVVAVLLVILDALATGALHYDGLADTADGFGGGKSREDILRIMRDHAIGSYGGLALASLVALKVTAYAALLKQSNWIVALILTPALGRWSILLLTATLPYARPSASAIESMGKRSLLGGTATVLVAMIAAMIAATSATTSVATSVTTSGRAWIAMAAVAAVTAAFGLYCRRRIAGITGDTLGANLQLCESAALLTFIWAGYPQ